MSEQAMAADLARLAEYLAAKAQWEELVWEHLATVPEAVNARRRMDMMKAEAGIAGLEEPLCCQRYSRLHHPAFSVAGCKWQGVQL